MRFKKIYVEIGNICNLHCLFCSLDGRSKRQMTLDEFSEVIQKIKGYTNYIYLHLKGEPLMHPNFREILEVCNKEKINVNLTTNATLLSKFKDVLLENECVRQVNISAHALPFIKNMDKEDYLNTVVDFIKENEKHLSLYISFRLWIKNRELNNYIFEFLSRKFNKEFNESSKKIASNAFFSFSEEFEWPNLEHEVVSLKGRCLGTFTHIAILANGDVTPCCLDSNGSEVLGNIFENSLEEILQGEKFRIIHEGFLKNELRSNLCKRCTYRTRFK